MRLAASNLAAGAVTALYTVPANKRAIVTLSLCNRAATSPKVRVAMTAGAAPSDADWLEYDTPIPASAASGGSVLERTGLALGAGQQLHVRADVAGVSAVVFGVEEAIG